MRAGFGPPSVAAWRKTKSMQSMGVNLAWPILARHGRLAARTRPAEQSLRSSSGAGVYLVETLAGTGACMLEGLIYLKETGERGHIRKRPGVQGTRISHMQRNAPS
jgi:hypothetical protein